MLKMAQACNTLGSEWVSWFIESAEMQAVIMAQMQRLRIEAATLRKPMPHSLLLHASEITTSDVASRLRNSDVVLRNDENWLGRMPFRCG